ncbi:MAG: 2-C-methyl-D-erythritol 4-phosphate cytidylyltransferase [Candidatus Aegiribacteria sp.]|nr:2-C-methyl-D-erythritol 4-phosphate cytidylyltransferase [Candidatus Aegiribacteria sp.]
MKKNTWGAVIVAAGSGTRFGSGKPKQFMKLHGRTLVDWSIDAFSAIEEIGEIVVVTPADSNLWKPFWNPPAGVKTVPGGRRRQDSVLAGLKTLDSSRRVLVHDAARPLVSGSLIRRVMKGVLDSGAAVPVIPVRDTVKNITSSSFIRGTVSRENLRMSQTPQGFTLDVILRVLKEADDVTDECGAMELAGLCVLAVSGEPGNIKLTDPEDLMIIESITGGTMESRTGIGLDFHPFEKGIPFVVGGCRIEADFGLSGHSDGDAVLHAVADALLSASRLGDIGSLFPPGDERWKGADSAILLEKVCKLVHCEGWDINQIDVTVISSFPKISPIREIMIERIAGITDTDPGRIWVKGTTTNTLGDIGRDKGLACMVMARISRNTDTEGTAHR